MNEEIKNKLLGLNQSFYDQFAESFSLSRGSPQQGYELLLTQIPETIEEVLDVGCGNGRFGKFLRSKYSDFEYVGIDFSPEILNKAEENVKGTFLKKDISKEGFLDSFGQFELIACLSTMQHIPGRANRVELLAEMGSHLTDEGKLITANWQFMDSPRQKRKLQRWEEVELSTGDVEPGDYLLSWNRDGFGLRYVCMIDAEETAMLAENANLKIVHQFRSDGKEGNLNLYSVFRKD